MLSRSIDRLFPVPDQSFVLLGARGVGKATFLRQAFPQAIPLDLQDPSIFLELSANPDRLEALAGSHPPGTWVILNNFSKIPEIIHPVRRLIENRWWRFVLCASSVRRLRPAGPATGTGDLPVLRLRPFSAHELGVDFDRGHALRWGMHPRAWCGPEPAEDGLRAYMASYLQEEILHESAVRSYAPFLRFIQTAARLNGQLINMQDVALEAEVPRTSAIHYYSLLADTMLGEYLPCWRPGLKAREKAHPKFYWFDPGVARVAAGLQGEAGEPAGRGMALENLVFHELLVHSQLRGKDRPIHYYRTGNGTEIDFLIETQARWLGSPPRVVCVEVKPADIWNRKWERTARELATRTGVIVERMIGVYLGSRRDHFDGFDVLPLEAFLAELHQGRVF